MTPDFLDEARKYLDNVTSNGDGLSARCPAHPDRRNSLSVRPGDTRGVIWKCHASCSWEEIRAALKALGMPDDVIDGRDGRSSLGRWDHLADYLYRDEKGNVLARKRRWRLPDGSRSFSWQHRDGKGEWQKGLGSVPRVLYHLPDVLAGVKQGQWIVVNEGEKAVDALAARDVVATCVPGGAGEHWRPEFTDVLAGAKVAVIADNDKPGREGAARIASKLHGKARVVKVIDLPDLPEGGDAYDYLEAGGNREALTAILESSPNWTPASSSGNGNAPTYDGESGATILDDVVAFVRRYLIVGRKEYADTIGLWAAHSHAIIPDEDRERVSFETTGRLFFVAPEIESGKTRALEVLEYLVHDPLRNLETSAAALVRVLTERPRTILLDEMENVFSRKAQDDTNKQLRGVLNAGYRYGNTVGRCVPEGRDQRATEFDTFGIAAMSGLGDKVLPDALRSRCIRIPLKRRRKDGSEPLTIFRSRKVKPLAEPLRNRLAGWVRSLDGVGDDEPELPEELSDRQWECWEPLVAIADRAGGDWPERARQAAKALSTAKFNDEVSHGSRLLGGIRKVFGEDEAMFSVDICDRLNALVDGPWGGWRDGEGIDQRTLARRLRDYEIKSKSIRIGEDTAKGYERKHFEDAWERYADEWPEDEEEQDDDKEQKSVPADPDSLSPALPNVTTSQPLQGNGSSRFPSVTPESAVTAENRPDPLQANDCDGVTAEGARKWATAFPPGWSGGHPLAGCVVCDSSTAARDPQGRPRHTHCPETPPDQIEDLDAWAERELGDAHDELAGVIARHAEDVEAGDPEADLNAW